jgi:hypothetical protein
MVFCRYAGEEKTVEQVQIINLENAANLPKGRCIKGMLAGNDNWRSPEAHFKGELNKPTDIFSFEIVVSASTVRDYARQLTSIVYLRNSGTRRLCPR